MPKKEFYNPNLEPSDEASIIRVATRYCVLPHPYVVSQLNGAVFPVIRNTAKRGEVELVNGKFVMYDDNTTPRWALLWAHGFLRSTFPPGGWTFAHVWNKSKDPEAYTHVANLVMMPESLASLSDKRGPLISVLRYHTQSKYGWRPNGESIVKKPDGYDELKWKYFEKICNPCDQIYSRLRELKSDRAKTLRQLPKFKNQV